MKKIFTFLLMIHLATIIMAQEQLSTKQLADKAFERYEYFRALNLYLALTDKSKPDWQVLQRVADCYRLMNDSRNAEQWYSQVIAEKKADGINLYYYAEALLQNNKVKEAKTQYQAYYASKQDPEALRFKLATCDSAAKWLANPHSAYKIMGMQKINSAYSDWGANYYGNKGFVFASNRGAVYDEGGKGLDKRSGNSYLKLYRSNKDSVLLLPASAEGKKIFNGDYHAGPAVFNRMADTAWITITTTQPAGNLPVNKRDKSSTQRLYTRRLMLVMATKAKNGEWGHFKKFLHNNVKAYSVGHAALSYDGQVLYFTSDMPGGEGKTDIWYCIKQTDGNWGKPLNCGKAINTKEEEAFPVTQGPDRLTFASKGLPGMGGFDIFSVKGKESAWSAPINYRHPVNSTADDFYLLTDDGQSGYFSSNRSGGIGDDDIYSFTYNQDAVPVLAKSDPAKKVGEIKPFIGFAPKDIHTIIYYDLDKANIRPDAAAELDKLVAVLEQNPGVKIKLASYTDVRASGIYNVGLSRRRSEAAMAYIVNKGIANDRISASWFGKNNPVVDCPSPAVCADAEHQLNRRTEVVYDGVIK